MSTFPPVNRDGVACRGVPSPAFISVLRVGDGCGIDNPAVHSEKRNGALTRVVRRMCAYIYSASVFSVYVVQYRSLLTERYMRMQQSISCELCAPLMTVSCRLSSLLLQVH